MTAWLLAKAPAERLATVRILVGAYAVIWLAAVTPSLLDLVRGDPDRFAPTGVLGRLDGPVDATLAHVVLALTLAAGVAFVAGAWFHVTGPVFAVGFLLASTYRSSWGQIFHTENLVALHLIVLALAPAAAAWSLDARRSGSEAQPSAAQGFPLRLMSIITVCVYVLAAVAKLRASGMTWVDGTVLRDQVAQDTLLKRLFGDPNSPVAPFLLHHGWLFRPMAAATIVVEVLAPVALLGGHIRDAWVAITWSFHVAVALVMTTVFPYELTGIAFASMFAVEKLGYFVRDNMRRFFSFAFR